LPARAETIFDRMSAAWGSAYSAEDSCRENPHAIAFSADFGRASFTWDQPITGYDGSIRKTADYTVLDHAADRITMALDGESRLTDAGVPVVWVLRLVQNGGAYCWGRTDWPSEACVALHLRCPVANATS
jgi:hypothetical protein